MLDFTNPPNLHAPRWNVPPGVGDACPTIDPSEFTDWTAIKEHAVRAGFDLP